MKGGGREQAGQRAQAAGSGALSLAAAGDARCPAAPAPHPPNPPLRQGPPGAHRPACRPGEAVRACLGTSPGVATAALTTQFIPRRSCAVPYGLPEVLPLVAHACPDPAEGLGPMR